MLCWCSLSLWIRESLAFSFAYNGGHYDYYRWQQLIYILITWLTGQKIVDAPLTLILPQACAHYATIHFGLEHQWLSFGGHSILFIGKSANGRWAALHAHAHTRSSYQASHGPLRKVQSLFIYSRFIQMCAWAYGTIYGCQPEIYLYLSLQPALLPVLYTLSLQVFMRARRRLKACSGVSLRACLRRWLRACLREPRFGTSRVFLHWKLLADGKLWVCGSFG